MPLILAGVGVVVVLLIGLVVLLLSRNDDEETAGGGTGGRNNAASSELAAACAAFDVEGVSDAAQRLQDSSSASSIQDVEDLLADLQTVFDELTPLLEAWALDEGDAASQELVDEAIAAFNDLIAAGEDAVDDLRRGRIPDESAGERAQERVERVDLDEFTAAMESTEECRDLGADLEGIF